MKVAASETGPRTLLAVGSGTDALPQWQEAGFRVVRLDIDPGMKPDVLASMTDMGEIGPFDMVYCSHSLEHIYPHEVPLALAEFHRVLRRGGAAAVIVPDLEGVDAGTEWGLHRLYGDARLIKDQPYMAHHCGFVEATLRDAMTAAGFRTVVKRVEGDQLAGVGVKLG